MNNLQQQVASRTTDPNFYASLKYLPNPDRVLRKIGKSQEVYDAIMGDAHVVGELRSIRSALLGFEWRVMTGSDDSASMRAFELCEKIMKGRPSPSMQWSDIIWTMACAVFKGFSVHEVIWQRHDRLLIPDMIKDRPQRRFLFGIENELRLLTRRNMTSGDKLDDHKWLVTHHMASFDNPYGLAVFSSCYWPYIFKHSGFKYFAKFCEKYGMPWPVGKYPQGTKPEEQEAFADQLANMVEDSVAVIPEGGAVELLSINTSGQPIQENLINLSNKEMSKALTSQTLATEIQGNGSRAASETHRERETAVNQSDRAIIQDTFNQLFQWVTELNFAGAVAPKFSFYEKTQSRKDMVDFLNSALERVPIKRSEYYQRIQMTPPIEGDDIIPVSSSGST